MYAKRTTVPIDRSKAEIEKTLIKYGADQFSGGWMTDKAVMLFRMRERYIRIEMPTAKLSPPTPSWNKKKGHFYTQDSVDQENKRRWRSLLLYVKAKLDSVESEIVSFEEAFMAHIVLPNKQTVSQFMQPQIEAAYQSGDMPKQLPGY